MADVQKYSIVNELRKKDVLKGHPSILGMSAMGYPQYVNAMRTTMETSQMKQFLNLLHSQFPYIFTSMENTAGKNSSGYKETKNDYEVYRKIVKFDKYVGDEPYVYTVFLYDRKKDKYDIFVRNPVGNLTENFAFEYDNAVMDSYEEGDIIPAGTVISKSKSYDADMNYGYGRNVNMMYTLDPYTAEDAAMVSKGLSDAMSSIEGEVITVKLNNNDYLLNMYGDEDDYLTLPELGSVINTGHICAVRRQYNSQLLYDFTNTSLREIHSGDDVVVADAGTEIVDFNIFSNNDEDVKITPFNEQLFELLDAQTEYFRQIYETCKEIKKSGSKYHKDINYWRKRSKEFLDGKKKWKDGDAAFSNFEIKITTRIVRGINLGQKLAGRYGNKSVASKIVPDELMPITEDGRRVDIMFNLLGIINRTTAFPLYEMFLNCASYKLRKRMVHLTWEERERELFEYLDCVEPSYAYKMRTIYNSYDEEGKQQFLYDAIDSGIFIHINNIPTDDNEAIFHSCRRLLNRYGDTWLKPDTLYVRNPYTGRDERVLNTTWVGEQYIMKLKQSDRRGASIRNAGAIDMTSLPTRNNKSKSHLERTSSTPIRFGEYESLNFSIGMIPDDIVLYNALYRTSSMAREAIINVMFDKDENAILKLPDTFTSRVGEIFNVYMKSLGMQFNFLDRDDIVTAYDDDTQYEWKIGDDVFICDEYHATLIDVAYEIRKEVIADLAFMPSDELSRQITDIMILRGYLKDGQTLFDENGEIDMDLVNSI